MSHAGQAIIDRSQDIVTMEVRNRDMAVNLEGLYCGAVREGKPVVADVGSDHLPGISEFLRRDI